MKSAAAVKYVGITPPAAKVDNAAFTTAAVDTAGWDHLTILCYYGDIDVNVASASIRMSDASNMGSPTTLKTGGTDFALATAANSDNKLHAFDIDLRGKQRYIDFEITGGDGTTGTYLTIVAILSRGREFPDTAADRGVEVYLAF